MARVKKVNAQQVQQTTEQEVNQAPEVATTIIVKDAQNVDAQEHVTEGVGTATVAHDGNSATTTLDDIGFEENSNVYGLKDKAAILAFYEEKLEIQIMESTDPNAEKAVFLSVNGEGAGINGEPWLPRGVAVTVKRKHVEKLARSRPTRYVSQQFVDVDGERKVRYPGTAALLYPFTVIRDNNPRGSDWLKAILAERA